MEAKLGKMANTLNRLEDGKLPNQPVANPRGQYMVDESTSNLKQVQAITTLRSWKMFDNHVEDTMDEQTEAPQNIHQDKGKQVSTKASSSAAPTLELPYKPRVPFPEHLMAPSHFKKQ
jgi:hypothetical protein